MIVYTISACLKHKTKNAQIANLNHENLLSSLIFTQSPCGLSNVTLLHEQTVNFICPHYHVTTKWAPPFCMVPCGGGHLDIPQCGEEGRKSSIFAAPYVELLVLFNVSHFKTSRRSFSQGLCLVFGGTWGMRIVAVLDFWRHFRPLSWICDISGRHFGFPVTILPLLSCHATSSSSHMYTENITTIDH